MVRVLASSVVDHGFEFRSGQTKDYKIGLCCFSAMHAALRSKSICGTKNEYANMNAIPHFFVFLYYL
jgi:hypothetical protein